MGTLGSPCNGKFSGFSFCLINPGVGAREAYNLETPTDTHKNKNKNPALSNQKIRKVAASKTENFETITILLQPNTTDKNSLYPCLCQEGQVGNLDLQLLQDEMKHSNCPNSAVSEG